MKQIFENEDYLEFINVYKKKVSGLISNQEFLEYFNLVEKTISTKLNLCELCRNTGTARRFIDGALFEFVCSCKFGDFWAESHPEVLITVFANGAETKVLYKKLIPGRPFGYPTFEESIAQRAQERPSRDVK